MSMQLPPGPSASSHQNLAHVPESLREGNSELAGPTSSCSHQPPQLADVPQSRSVLHAWSPEEGPWLQVAPAPGLLDLCLGERGALGAICRGSQTQNQMCLLWARPRSLSAGGSCCTPAQTLPPFCSNRLDFQRHTWLINSDWKAAMQVAHIGCPVGTHVGTRARGLEPLNEPEGNRSIYEAVLQEAKRCRAQRQPPVAFSRPGRHPPAPVSSRVSVSGCSGCAEGMAGPQ